MGDKPIQQKNYGQEKRKFKGIEQHSKLLAYHANIAQLKKEVRNYRLPRVYNLSGQFLPDLYPV